VKGELILIKSLKKLINKTVYENAAEYPWAKFKDFIISEDGKHVKSVVIMSESLIPVPYTVRICDFAAIGDKKAILKPQVKPTVLKIEKEKPYMISNIKKHRFKKDGHSRKIFDVNFDTEAGEIVDFIITPFPTGRKMFISPDSNDFDSIMSFYLNR